jgi:hypothetical protein
MCSQIDEKAQRVLLRWTRVRVATPWGQRISSVEAWDHYNEWKQFIDEMNAANGPEAGTAVHTSDTWVRMISERRAIQGTGVSIGVAMMCAVVSIYIFTGDVLMSLLTLLNVTAIVLVEVHHMRTSGCPWDVH